MEQAVEFYITQKLQIAILRKDGDVKEVIKAYRQTREALLARCEELCERRGNCDRRIAVLEAEIEEVEEVLRVLAKYDEDEPVESKSA